MPCFGINPLQEISSYLWINGTLTFDNTYRKNRYLKMIKNWSFAYTTHILREKKLSPVIVFKNHYLNKIFAVHPLKLHTDSAALTTALATEG